MKLSIKNRIALYSVIGIAGVSLVVFIAIFFTVKNTVYNEIDKDLYYEANKHKNELTFTKDSLYFTFKDEWLEREHLEIEVNPLFVELFDRNGNSLDKSPNLQAKNLALSAQNSSYQISDEKLENEKIRQVQFAVERDNEIKGFIVIAVPLGDAEMVIETLQNSLLIIYPILLLITFFTSRLISRITIKPIKSIAKIVNEINTADLSKRVPENNTGDELAILSHSINDFLDRIDASIKREKRFTANASHQLRTPLAVLKGDLEVLIRKPRQTDEYIETIKKNIQKIDSMADAVEKLLILARLNNNQHQKMETELFSIAEQIESILTNYKKQIIYKKLSIQFEKAEDEVFDTNKTYLNLILDNLISNAVKYAFEKTKITIIVHTNSEGLYIQICNEGPQIKEEDFNEIFNPFYRNNNDENHEEGFGLGLAIAAKASRFLHITVQVSSAKETCFSLTIPKKSQT